MRNRTLTVWLSILAISLVTSLTFAQAPAGGGNGGGNGGGGGRRGGGAGGPGGGNFNFATMIKDQLKPVPSDDEWKVIEPLLTKVTDLQRQTRGGMMGGRNRGNRGGGAPDAAAAPAAPAAPAAAAPGTLPEADALQKALADDNAKPEDVKAKLDAYRAAIKKVNDQLKTAREDLRKVLTPKQEAQLVLMSILD